MIFLVRQLGTLGSFINLYGEVHDVFEETTVDIVSVNVRSSWMDACLPLHQNDISVGHPMCWTEKPPTIIFINGPGRMNEEVGSEDAISGRLIVLAIGPWTRLLLRTVLDRLCLVEHSLTGELKGRHLV